MIDTDKYEKHTEGPWKLGSYFSGWKIYWFDKELSDNWDSIRDFGEEYRHEDFCYDVGVVASTEANARLMADAPLLLAEVKRLRELLLPRIDEGYTTSYMDLRKIIEDVHWELTGDEHESNEERIKYALIALRDVIG